MQFGFTRGRSRDEAIAQQLVLGARFRGEGISSSLDLVDEANAFCSVECISLCFCFVQKNKISLTRAPRRGPVRFC